MSTFGHTNPTCCAEDTVHNEINYPIDKEIARYHRPITIYYCKSGQAYGAQGSYCWWCTRARHTLYEPYHRLKVDEEFVYTVDLLSKSYF